MRCLAAIAVVATTTVIGILAGLLPAARAARMDPVEALRTEYLAIHAGGFLVQVDDAVLANMYDHLVQQSAERYREWAQLRVDALNHALRGIPRQRIRLHVCWGSFHGPHQADIPLAEIADVIFSVKASGYSIEASNPVHEHEWHVFEKVRIPDGSVLIPGVIESKSNFIEHPELVAQRIGRYANLVGRENVMAGSDCGFGTWVGQAAVDPQIVWAKLAAMAEGARIASAKFWK